MWDAENKIPKNLAKLHLSQDEIQTIGQILGIDIVFYGSINSSLSKTPTNKTMLSLTSSLQSINVSTGRNLSLTSFTVSVPVPQNDMIKFEYNVIRDLMVKNLKKSTENIVASWINGTFNSTSYKILFKGSLSFTEYTKIKYFLKNDIKSITSVEDDVLSKNRKIVNVESNESISTLKEEIEKTSIDNFQLNVLPMENEGVLEIQLMRL